MTNPGPWTATGRPETKKSRTWWIVGGVVLAVLAVFTAYLMGRGWDTAVEQEAARTSPTTSSATPTPPADTAQNKILEGGVGGNDPVALSDRIEEIVGVSITPVQVDSLATRLCNSLDLGATNRQVADEAADATSGHWTDTQARSVAMMLMLEYCPRHAE